MKVYVLVFDWNKGTNAPGYDATVEAVFTTRAKAEEHVSKQLDNSHYSIEEHELNG